MLWVPPSKREFCQPWKLTYEEEGYIDVQINFFVLFCIYLQIYLINISTPLPPAWPTNLLVSFIFK
jgi:hypothetical protein